MAFLTLLNELLFLQQQRQQQRWLQQLQQKTCFPIPIAFMDDWRDDNALEMWFVVNFQNQITLFYLMEVKGGALERRITGLTISKNLTILQGGSASRVTRLCTLA